MPFYPWSARTPRLGSQLWGRVLSTRQRELSPAPAFSSSEQDTGTRVTSESFCSACREDSVWGEGSESPRPTGGAPFQPAHSGPTWASRKGTPSSSHKEGLSPISLVGGWWWSSCLLSPLGCWAGPRLPGAGGKGAGRAAQDAERDSQLLRHPGGSGRHRGDQSTLPLPWGRRDRKHSRLSLSTTESCCPTTAKGGGQSHIIVE